MLRFTFRKFVPRRQRIPEDYEEQNWEGFSGTFEHPSPNFSYVQTPSSAYQYDWPTTPPRTAVRSSSGNFISYENQDLSWFEPVDSPLPIVNQHRNFRFVGARFEDGSSIARYSSNSGSSWETADNASNSVMSSLLGGIPDVPNGAPLRRRQGRSNLRLRSTPVALESASTLEAPSVGQYQSTTPRTPNRAIQVETLPPIFAEHDLRQQPSVPDATELMIFIPTNDGISFNC